MENLVTCITDSRTAWRKSPPSAADTRDEIRPSLILAALLVFVAFWTAYHTALFSANVIDHDSAEAYAWGREFQFGYYKHPPFWAWICGAWFLVFPRSDWAYALLISLNAALGLLGAWKLIGCFSNGNQRSAATLLLLFTPFYTVFNDRYGGNTIFLSLWPWTAYLFVLSFRTRRISYAVGFGILAGLDILSKYYAVLFLGTCLAGALLHPGRRNYFRSAAPYSSMLVAAALCVPHLWWLPANSFGPVQYFLSNSNQNFTVTLIQFVSLIGWCSGGLTIPLIIVAFMRSIGWHKHLSILAGDPEFRLMTCLCLLPFALTLVFTLLFSVHLSERTSVSNFCLVPLLLTKIFDVCPSGRTVSRLAWIPGLFSLAAAAISPAIAYEGWYTSVRYAIGEILEAKRELAEQATNIWHRETGTNLGYVGGPFPLADSIVFYSKDHPSEFIELNYGFAPWVTRGKLARRGLLVVCAAKDTKCIANSKSVLPNGSLHVKLAVAHTFDGLTGPLMRYDLFLYPPHSDRESAALSEQKPSE